MIVLVLTAVPPGLRGDLTRWLLEIAPGTFVGHVPSRVRDRLWERVVDGVRDGRALMVHSSPGEQRLAFKVHGHDWTPVDHDGLHLMLRPLPPAASSDGETSSTRAPAPEGWSTASRRRRFRR